MVKVAVMFALTVALRVVGDETRATQTPGGEVGSGCFSHSHTQLLTMHGVTRRRGH